MKTFVANITAKKNLNACYWWPILLKKILINIAKVITVIRKLED
jgi:hypothetical protein